MNILVTVNGIGGPKILCLISEDEIDLVIKRVVDEFIHDYGQDQVAIKDLPIDDNIKSSYPTIFKSVEVSGKMMVDSYKIWIEFHKRSLENVDRETLRNIIM